MLTRARERTVSMEQQSGLSGIHITAQKAAALRAAHSLLGAEPKVFDDTLALPLTGMAESEVIAMGTRQKSGAAGSCVGRGRFTEDRLAAARDRLDQYVVLGAGLDSYALRMGDSLGDLTVFEVDDLPFQAWKRQRIKELGLKEPKQLRYTPCDFEKTSIADALAATGFDASKPCFISWLGVTQYLTPEASAETLRWAAQCAPGSEIVLTFSDASVADDSYNASIAANNLPFLTLFTADEMTGMLEKAGFSIIEHLTEEEENRRYFANRTDGLVAPAVQRLVSAIV